MPIKLNNLGKARRALRYARRRRIQRRPRPARPSAQPPCLRPRRYDRSCGRSGGDDGCRCGNAGRGSRRSRLRWRRPGRPRSAPGGAGTRSSGRCARPDGAVRREFAGRCRIRAARQERPTRPRPDEYPGSSCRVRRQRIRRAGATSHRHGSSLTPVVRALSNRRAPCKRSAAAERGACGGTTAARAPRSSGRRRSPSRRAIPTAR